MGLGSYQQGNIEAFTLYRLVFHMVSKSSLPLADVYQFMRKSRVKALNRSTVQAHCTILPMTEAPIWLIYSSARLTLQSLLANLTITTKILRWFDCYSHRQSWHHLVELMGVNAHSQASGIFPLRSPYSRYHRRAIYLLPLSLTFSSRISRLLFHIRPSSMMVELRKINFLAERKSSNNCGSIP